MEIANLPAEKTLSSRYTSALLLGNILSWLFIVPGILFSASANGFVRLLPKTHWLFEIFGQLRLLFSFFSELLSLATLHTPRRLEHRIAYTTKADLFNR